MPWYFWVMIAGIALCIVSVGAAFYCYRRIFYSPKRKPLGEDEYEIPEGEIYEPYRAQMIEWIKAVRAMPHEEIFVISVDGLTLHGRYYECKAGAPVELLFHGYRGCGERDLCGGVERCFALDRNALIIDQRASGESEGKVITFGIKERLDCLKWIEFAIERFGKDVKIILTGISMGAATVLMATGEKLPDNVICMLADCGYTSPKAIIKKVVRDMKLPTWLVYPFVRLGARLFGRFNLEEASPLEAMKKSTVPVIFVHGETDDFVPCDMSRENFEACVSVKRIVTIPNAGHGLAYPADKEKYLQALREFEKEYNP